LRDILNGGGVFVEGEEVDHVQSRSNSRAGCIVQKGRGTNSRFATGKGKNKSKKGNGKVACELFIVKKSTHLSYAIQSKTQPNST